jgi:hypothetical protein
MSGTTELSIVIVNWNGGTLLRRCIESISRYPPDVSYEIIVVDNASTDDSLAWVRSLGANVRIIANEQNVGFARANNRAFAESRSNSILLLNPDAEVTEGAIDRLLGTLRNDPRVAACAPRLLNPDGSLQPSVRANPLTPLHIAASAFGVWRILPRGIRGRFLFSDHWSYDSLRAVPAVFGAALVVKRKVIDEIGGLDERFEMYSEDSEWCLRARRAGMVILFDPRATVIHHGGSFAVARWGNLGALKVKTEAYLLLQRVTLSRFHRVANVITLSVVTLGQVICHRVRGSCVEEARMRLALYGADLAREFGFAQRR